MNIKNQEEFVQTGKGAKHEEGGGKVEKWDLKEKRREKQKYISIIERVHGVGGRGREPPHTHTQKRVFRFCTYANPP